MGSFPAAGGFPAQAALVVAAGKMDGRVGSSLFVKRGLIQRHRLFGGHDLIGKSAVVMGFDCPIRRTAIVG